MIIIWRGWGILAALIPIAMLLFAALVGEALVGADVYSRSYGGWFSLLAVLAASATIWSLGRRLNREARVFIDAETGARLAVRPNHSLFFIRLEYWSVILPIAAAALAFA